MASGGVGLGARLQAWLTGGSAKAKGTPPKGKDAKVDGKGASAGVKAKGKTAGKGGAALNALAGQPDEFGVQDDEERERKKRQRLVMGEVTEQSGSFVAQDKPADKNMVSNISAEFRGQVAAGMISGRSFTQGSCLVADPSADDDDELEAPPVKKVKKKR